MPDSTCGVPPASTNGAYRELVADRGELDGRLACGEPRELLQAGEPVAAVRAAARSLVDWWFSNGGRPIEEIRRRLVAVLAHITEPVTIDDPEIEAELAIDDVRHAPRRGKLRAYFNTIVNIGVTLRPEASPAEQLTSGLAELARDQLTTKKKHGTDPSRVADLLGEVLTIARSDARTAVAGMTDADIGTVIITAIEHAEQSGRERAGRHFLKPSKVEARPIEWLVEGWLPAGMLTVLHATDKSGKTLIAWELGRAVADGKPFLGKFPTRRGRVLLALLDDSAPINSFRRDLFGLAAFDDSICMMTEYPEAENGMPLPPEQVIQIISEACDAFRPAFVVLDALYQFFPTSRDAGNDASRMKMVMAMVNRLTRRGAAALLVAHDRKGEDDVAGSYVIRATAKQLLHLQKYPLRQATRDGEPRPTDTGRRLLRITGKLSTESTHALRLRDPGRFEYVSDDIEAARAEWDRERQESTAALVRAWFEAGKQGTVDDAVRAAGRRRVDVLAAIKSLEVDGFVQMYKLPSTGGRPGTGYRRKTNDAPREEAIQGTKVSDPAGPCERSVNAETLSFRSRESSRNESPPGGTVGPEGEARFRTFVPPLSFSLGKRASFEGARKVDDEAEPGGNDCLLEADAEAELPADDCSLEVDDDLDDLIRCTGCGDTACRGC
jgi:hypothetical protein